MSQYLVALIYIPLGLTGAYFHYLKKRYVDQEICCPLIRYILDNRQQTYNALTAALSAEIVLITAGGGTSLHDIVAAILAGYAADTLNKGSK